MAVEEAVDLGKLEEILGRYGGERGTLIPVLQAAQDAYGFLPRPVLEEISKRLGVPLSRVYGVVTFYSQFYLERRGRNIIRCCDGTACHVRGTPNIVRSLEDKLGVSAGQTTEDYSFTLEVVYCLGSCALAPVVVVNGRIHGQMTPEKATRAIDRLRREEASAN
jgi:NADH:ubiquinone oxidoreductase subunit E